MTEVLAELKSIINELEKLENCSDGKDATTIGLVYKLSFLADSIYVKIRDTLVKKYRTKGGENRWLI